MADKKTISSEQWAAYSRNDLPTGVNGLMRGAYLQYSVSANIGRAIPDVRDGLKPGARRILYAMRQGGYTSGGGLNKCAKVVGLVIGNYHPHGDSSVYDTIVRLAQDFSMRVPLIHGHGNFGSMDGDPPAAYRYTECKMDKAAEALLADLDKDTVDMRETFDAKELEPIVLPAAFPNLLVNGSQGIGVGMATNVPTHNLGEAIDAAVALIDNPNLTVDELMEILPGPDYPTGGIIHGLKGIRSLYTTGQGGIRVRGKAEVVTAEGRGRDKIIVSEIPYGVNKAKMVGQIGELAQSGAIKGIASINDYSSSRNGVHIEIELKQDATPSVVLNELFKNTQLEIVDPAQFLVVDHNRPRTMTLKQILMAYIDHREQVVTRRTRYLLQKALERDHIVQGLLIAQANIDEVIQIIRSSRDRQESTQRLMARFPLDEVQCAAILDMRLAALTNLAVADLTNEHNDLQAKIAEYNRILSCRANIMAVVREELLKTKAQFNTPRRTRIESVEGEMDLDGLTKREIYMVTLSRLGYIKRCSADEYETQNRGGSGVIGMRARKDGDTVQMVFSTRSHNTLLFFTNYGRAYRLDRAYSLPESGRGDSGRFIANVLNLIHDDEHPEQHEEIRAVISFDEKTIDLENNFVVMVTKKGVIKRTALALFKNINRRGLIALNIKEGDDLLDAQLTDGNHELLLSSQNGRAVRFHETQVRAMGRQAAGVRGIKLKPDDDGTPGCVVSMAVVEPEDELLIVTAHGIGKRTPIGSSAGDAAPPPPSDDDNAAAEENATEEAEAEEAEEAEESAPGADNSAFRYRLTNRGTQGVRSIKLRPGDRVVAAMQIPPECGQDLLMLSSKGQAVRIPVAQAKRCSRNSQGVILMRLSKKDDLVANVSLVDVLSEEDAAANAAKAAEEEENAAAKAAFEESQAAEQAKLDAEDDSLDAPLETDAPASADSTPDAPAPASDEAPAEPPEPQPPSPPRPQ